MTAQAAPAVGYCSKCGREARITERSIDPRYPIVHCAYRGQDGEDRGHGNVPGLLDKAEAERRVNAAHRARLAMAHPAHVAAGRARPECPICETDPPAAKGYPHYWARIRNRHRLASHLDLAHGNRTLLANLNTRPLEDFMALHAELHGDPTIR